MTNEDDYLDRASTISFEKLEEVGGNMQSLNEPYRTLALIYSAQGVIDNGGLIYFFENDWPGNPPYSICSDAYRRIGRIEAGDAIDAAAESFGIRFPERDQAHRSEFMNKQFGTDGSEGVYEVEWDDCICGDEQVWSDLVKWSQTNAGDAFD